MAQQRLAPILANLIEFLHQRRYRFALSILGFLAFVKIGSLRDSHIATRGASLLSSVVWFPNGSPGRSSSAHAGSTTKPTVTATTAINAAIRIFGTRFRGIRSLFGALR